MFGYALGSLLVAAGVCLHAGLSQLCPSFRRRAPIHLLFGGMCLVAFCHALASVQLYQSTSLEQYIVMLRCQLILSGLFHIALVWFAAFYTSQRPIWFLIAHNVLCVLLLILNGVLPNTLLFLKINELETLTLPWGETVRHIDALSSPWANLAGISYSLSFGFAYLCALGQLRRNLASSGFFLALAVSLQLAGTALAEMVDVADRSFVFVGTFALVGFILVMAFRLAYECEAADSAFRQSESQFRQMVETIREFVYLADPLDGRYLYVSPGYEILTGRSPAELQANSRSWLEAVVASDRPRVQQGFAYTRKGVPLEQEYRIEHADRSIRWVSDRAAPLLDEEGRVSRVAGVARDITGQKQAEASSRQAETLQRLTLESISDAVLITDDAGNFTFICPNANVIFGYQVDEIQQMGCIDRLLGGGLFDPEQLRQAGEVRNIENRIQDKFGLSHDLLITVRQVSINGGTRLFVCRDITERKQAESELLDSQQLLQRQLTELAHIYRTFPVGLCFLDRNLNFVRINDELASINRLPVEDHLGRHFVEVLPDLAETIEPIYRRVLETGVPEMNIEVQRPAPPSGELRNYRASYYPVTQEDGSVLGVSTVVQDITQSKRIEQALRENEEQTTAILASLSAHIAVLDRTGTIVAVNPAWENFARQNRGSPKSCDVGANYLEVCRTARGEHADQAHQVLEGLQAILAGYSESLTVEYPCHSPTKKRWFLLQATCLRNGRGGAVVSHTNITERRQTEEALRHAHEFSESLINTAQSIVLVLDVNGRIVRFNRYMEELTGWQLEEIRGHDWFEAFIPERDRTCIRELFGHATTGRRTQGNINSILTKDGQEREVEWYDAPLTDPDGRLMGLLCTGQDVTDRQMLQREVLEIAAQEQRRIGQELHDSTQQQLTGLGLLAQSIARTLETIHSKEYAAHLAGPLAELHGRARQVHHGLQHAAREVNQLARGLIPVEIDAQGLMSALTELACGISEVHPATCSFHAAGTVEVGNNPTATHLYRIAQEAVNNAIKHSQADRIDISLSKRNGVICLRVLDNGQGIGQNHFNGPGMGLRIMAYRAELIGAALKIGPGPSGGTEVACTISQEN